MKLVGQVEFARAEHVQDVLALLVRETAVAHHLRNDPALLVSRQQLLRATMRPRSARRRSDRDDRGTRSGWA